MVLRSGILRATAADAVSAAGEPILPAGSRAGAVPRYCGIRSAWPGTITSGSESWSRLAAKMIWNFAGSP